MLASQCKTCVCVCVWTLEYKDNLRNFLDTRLMRRNAYLCFNLGRLELNLSRTHEVQHPRTVLLKIFNGHSGEFCRILQGQKDIFKR